MGTPTAEADVEYPDSDGEPMSDNTRQYDWMATLKWAAEAQFRDRPDVFVAGDHLIYATPGDPNDRQAPDVYVAFGRPKGDRGSYKRWEEAGVFPQVIFEVWSPSNTADRMDEKLLFYDRHGADEYYIVYPDFPAHARGWRRDAGGLTEVDPFDGYVSPRLGWRFEVGGGAVTVYGPDGRPLERPDAVYAERDEIRAEIGRITAEIAQLAAARDAEIATREALLAALSEVTAVRNAALRDRDSERERADAERGRADAEKAIAAVQKELAGSYKSIAESHAERANMLQAMLGTARATAATEARINRMAAKLRELGVDPDAA